MRTQKVYISIVLGLILLATGFLALRSDVPSEPIKIYKAVAPQAKSTAEAPAANSQGGHVHADGDPFHAEPHTKTEGTVERTRDNAAMYEQRLTEKEQLQVQLADLERVVAENKAVIAKKRVMIKEVEAFDEWLSNIDMFDQFSDLFDLLSLSDEEIREAFSAEEFKSLMTKKVSLFNTIRADFLNRIESCSPGAREIIYTRINATPELKRIYQEYIEKPLAPVGGIQ